MFHAAHLLYVACSLFFCHYRATDCHSPLKGNILRWRRLLSHLWCHHNGRRKLEPTSLKLENKKGERPRLVQARVDDDTRNLSFLYFVKRIKVVSEEPVRVGWPLLAELCHSFLEYPLYPVLLNVFLVFQSRSFFPCSRHLHSLLVCVVTSQPNHAYLQLRNLTSQPSHTHVLVMQSGVSKGDVI